MVAFEQARLSMQMLTEVRNKLVEAYQEVSRMPL
jgi:flagellar hook-basal body complex protein FliE